MTPDNEKDLEARIDAWEKSPRDEWHPLIRDLIGDRELLIREKNDLTHALEEARTSRAELKERLEKAMELLQKVRNTCSVIASLPQEASVTTVKDEEIDQLAFFRDAIDQLLGSSHRYS